MNPMQKKAQLKISDKKRAQSLRLLEFLKLFVVLILVVILVPIIRGFLIGLLIVLVFSGDYFSWTSSNLVSILQVIVAIGIATAIQYFISMRRLSHVPYTSAFSLSEGRTLCLT